MAVFATGRLGPDFDELPMPRVAPWTTSGRVEAYVPEFAAPFSDRVVLQQRLGPEALSSPDGPMVSGGWLAFSDRRPIDAPGLLVLCDAGMMPWWVRLPAMIPTATLDLTMHFRSELPRTDPDEPIATRVAMLGLLGQLGKPSCVPEILPLLQSDQRHEVEVALLFDVRCIQLHTVPGYERAQGEQPDPGISP